MSRTKRKPYTGSKAIDKSCRSHGDCPWCEGKRKYKDEKAKGVHETTPCFEEKE